MQAPDELFAELEAMVPAGQQPFFAHFARDLLEEDLILGRALPSAARKPAGLKAIRGSHHEAARLVGLGKSVAEISLITGYSVERIYTLKQDPAFCELVAHYQGQVEELYYDTHKRLAGFTNDAMEILHERLLEAPEKIKTNDLKDLLTLGLDRTGFGPKSTINTNIKAVVITNAELERIKGEAAAARLGTTRQLETQRLTHDPGAEISGTGSPQPTPETTPAREQSEGAELRTPIPAPLQLELALGSKDSPQSVDKI